MPPVARSTKFLTVLGAWWPYSWTRMSPAEVCRVAICVATVMRELLQVGDGECPSSHAAPTSEPPGDAGRVPRGLSRGVGAADGVQAAESRPSAATAAIT